MKRILIIDDDCMAEEDSIREGFHGTEVEIFLCESKDEAFKQIRSRALFDCVVLDWYLEDENSELSQLILKELEGTYYAPVLIYSSYASNFRSARDEGRISYPSNLIQEVEKGNFSEIYLKIESWLNTNITARMSSIYLQKVYDHIHKTFWGLNKIPDGNIAAAYTSILSDQGVIDWSYDFIINNLLQSLTSDQDFRDSVSRLISSISSAGKQTSEDQRRQIINTVLYNKYSPSYVSNGDIVMITGPDLKCFGFIATPDCDLAQKNTRFLEFIELVKHGSLPLQNSTDIISMNKNEKHFFLPAVKIDSELNDLVAVFNARHFMTAKDNKGEKYPSVKHRIKYGDTFEYLKTECQLHYLCSLANPYKAEFNQKRISHGSRVGIPPIYQYLKG